MAFVTIVATVHFESEHYQIYKANTTRIILYIFFLSTELPFLVVPSTFDVLHEAPFLAGSIEKPPASVCMCVCDYV